MKDINKDQEAKRLQMARPDGHFSPICLNPTRTIAIGGFMVWSSQWPRRAPLSAFSLVHYACRCVLWFDPAKLRVYFNSLGTNSLVILHLTQTWKLHILQFDWRQRGFYLSSIIWLIAFLQYEPFICASHSPVLSICGLILFTFSLTKSKS